MSDLESFISTQRTANSEPGGFTLNSDRAARLLGAYSSDVPYWYLIPLLQALVIDNARKVEIKVDKSSLTIETELFDVLFEEPEQLVQQELPRTDSVTGLLCRAIHGCRATKPARLELAGPKRTLIFEGPEGLETSRQGSAVSRFRVEFDWPWLKAGVKRGKLVQFIRNITRFFPLQIDIDKRAPDRDWPAIPGVIVCEAYRAGGTVGFSKPDLSVYRQVEDSVYLYQSGTPDEPRRSYRMPCTLVFTTSKEENFSYVLAARTGTPQFFLVRHGLVTETLKLKGNLSTLELADLGLCVVVDVTEFKTDVGGLRSVRDQAFHSRIRELIQLARSLNQTYAQNIDWARTARLQRQSGPIGWATSALALTTVSIFSRRHAKKRDKILVKLLESDPQQLFETAPPV